MIAAERVARGVALLDQMRPGWAGHIDLSKFDIFWPDSCVLGQLYGDYGIGRDAVGLTYETDREHGFDVSGAVGPMELNLEWRRVIAERQGGAR